MLARPYLSVKDPYTDFAREFEHQLKSSGALLQPISRQDSTATIEVTKDVVEQRTLAVSARNIPTDYELIYTVTFAVQGPDKQLLAPQTISLVEGLQLSRRTSCWPKSTRRISCARRWRAIWWPSPCAG